MIDPQKIGFDIDGVLANTMQLFLDILLEVYGINHISLDDITRYELEACLDIDPQIISAANQSIIDGNHPGRLAPMDGAARVLKRLSAYGPIRLVTARPYPGPIRTWVEGILPSDQYPVQITATGSFDSKADILKSEDITFFVEDRLETCFLLQNYDITPVLFAQPWNRQPHPFEEVDSWAQLERLIDWGA
jgi:5'(3')-deoxyribonucleotidase